MSTMQKIADAIGVSKTTVSRALNETGYVGVKTRQRILEVAEELGYRPNLLAKNLSTNQSKCIGLVMANKMFDGHYFNEIVSFCARKLQSQGLDLLLADGKSSAEGEHAAIALLAGLRCDAIILYSHFLTTEDLDALIERTTTPIMVINRELKLHPAHTVCCDHQHDAYRVAHRLIESGYREIGVISGNLNSPTAKSRQAGIQAALQEAQLAEHAAYMEGNWSIESGYQAMQKLLSEKPSLDAVIAANDEMAIGAMRSLAEAGKKIPEDIAIVGFDDIPAAAYLVPTLSSVKAPVRAMLEIAIEQIYAQLEGKELRPVPLFHSELEPRESIKSLSR